MDQTEKQSFKMFMAAISELYPRHEVTEAMADLYFSALMDYSLQEISAALLAHLRDQQKCAFAPMPGDLIAKIPNAGAQNIKQRALAAWNEVYAGLSRCGPYQTMRVGDKRAVSAVQAAGGWEALCSKTYSELAWSKKEFLAHYEAMGTTPDSELLLEAPAIQYEPKLDRALIAADKARLSHD